MELIKNLKEVSLIKNLSLAMDIGIPPERKFSKNYQSGILSFEIFYSGKKRSYRFLSNFTTIRNVSED